MELERGPALCSHNLRGLTQTWSWFIVQATPGDQGGRGSVRLAARKQAKDGRRFENCPPWAWPTQPILMCLQLTVVIILLDPGPWSKALTKQYSF